MNKNLRLATLRDWHQNSPEQVIDFTRYDLPAQEPPDADPLHPQKDWSLMNRINQKGLRSQDTPTLFRNLQQEDQDFIHKALPLFRA